MFFEWNIYSIQLFGRAGTSGRPQTLIASTGADYLPQYSPDGRKIAFNSRRGPNDDIWVCDRDGSNLLQLASLKKKSGRTPHWAPDGESIVCDWRPEGQSDLCLIAVDGGAPQRLTVHPAGDVVPSWSRDGRWIYFSSNRSGTEQVWKIRPDGSGAVQVTEEGGFSPVDSPDGKTLYCTRGIASPTNLWSRPVMGGEERKVLEYLSCWGNFAVVEDGIYFIPYLDPADTTGYIIQFISLPGNQLPTVVTFEKPPANGLTVSPDRRFLLYCQRDREGMDLFLIENFRRFDRNCADNPPRH